MLAKSTALYMRTAQKKDEDVAKQETRLMAGIPKSDKVKVYSDNGYSGLTSDRPALNRLKSDIASGQISAICCTNISRISRNIISYTEFVNFLKQNGVQLFMLSEEIGKKKKSR